MSGRWSRDIALAWMPLSRKLRTTKDVRIATRATVVSCLPTTTILEVAAAWEANRTVVSTATTVCSAAGTALAIGIVHSVIGSKRRVHVRSRNI